MFDVIKWIVGAVLNVFVKEVRYLKDGFSDIKNGGFKSNVIGSLGAVFSLITFLISAGSFVFLYIKFIVTGGYQESIHFESLTGGDLVTNAGVFYANPLFAVLLVCNMIVVVFALISFFQRFNLMRILEIVLIVAEVVLFAIYAKDPGKLPDWYSLIILGVFILAVVILCKSSEVAASALRLLTISFLLIPLITLILEEVRIAIMFALLVVLYFILSAVFEGGASESASTADLNEPSASAPPKTDRSKKNDSSAENIVIAELNQLYIDEYIKITGQHPRSLAYNILNDDLSRRVKALRNSILQEARSRGVKNTDKLFRW